MCCCNMYWHNKFSNLFILNFIECQSCKDNFHSFLYCIIRWWNCNFFSPNNALLKSRHWLKYPKLEEIVCNIKAFTLTPKFSVPLNVRMQFSCTWKASPHSSICTHSTNLSSTTTSYNKHFLGSKLETVSANSERDVKWAFWLYFPSYVYPSGKKGFFFLF